MSSGSKLIARKSWVLALAAVLMAVYMLLPATAHAASQDITMTPTSVSPVIDPGTEFKGSFQVINQGDSAYKFLVYAAPYKVSGEEYTPDFTVLPGAPNITGWFNFSAPGGNIKPGDAVTISYTINVPDNTQPGGYYAAAFAETQFPKGADSITLNQRVGELFYIQVAGPVEKKGQLLTWESKLFQEPPLTSTLRLQNDGSVHFPSEIQISVTDILGHTKFSFKTEKELLPQSIRKISAPWDKTPAIGLFKVSGTAKFLDKNETLPTKWVLVLSSTVKIIIGVIFALMVLIIILLPTVRALRAKRRAKKSKKI